MSRAYLFIETGEVRAPKAGEWTISKDGIPDYWASDSIHSIPRTIVSRHEISIPEGAINIGIDFQDHASDGPWMGHRGIIPLPRPRRKIKKWRYLYGYSSGQASVSGGHFKDDEEFLSKVDYRAEWYRPIPETMTEVEED